MGKERKKQTTRSSQTYSPEVIARSENLANRAQALGQQGFTPYSGAINAARNQNLNTAGSLANLPSITHATAGRDHLEGSTYDPSTARGFINQYMDASAPALADIDERAAINRRNIQSGSANPFGSRSYIQQGQADRNADRMREGIYANAIGQGIATGQRAHESNIQSRQFAEQQLRASNLANQSLRNQQIGNLMNTGTTLQGLDQADLNRNYANWQYNQQQPWTQMSQEAAILSGVPMNRFGSSTTRQTSQTPWGQTVLQGAFGLGAAYLGMPPSAGAAVGGAIGGGGAGIPRPRPGHLGQQWV